MNNGIPNPNSDWRYSLDAFVQSTDANLGSIRKYSKQAQDGLESNAGEYKTLASVVQGSLASLKQEVAAAQRLSSKASYLVAGENLPAAGHNPFGLTAHTAGAPPFAGNAGGGPSIFATPTMSSKSQSSLSQGGSGGSSATLNAFGDGKQAPRDAPSLVSPLRRPDLMFSPAAGHYPSTTSRQFLGAPRSLAASSGSPQAALARRAAVLQKAGPLFGAGDGPMGKAEKNTFLGSGASTAAQDFSVIPSSPVVAAIAARGLQSPASGPPGRSLSPPAGARERGRATAAASGVAAALQSGTPNSSSSTHQMAQAVQMATAAATAATLSSQQQHQNQQEHQQRKQQKVLQESMQVAQEQLVRVIDSHLQNFTQKMGQSLDLGSGQPSNANDGGNGGNPGTADAGAGLRISRPGAGVSTSAGRSQMSMGGPSIRQEGSNPGSRSSSPDSSSSPIVPERKAKRVHTKQMPFTRRYVDYTDEEDDAARGRRQGQQAALAKRRSVDGYLGESANADSNAPGETRSRTPTASHPLPANVESGVQPQVSVSQSLYGPPVASTPAQQPQNSPLLLLTLNKADLAERLCTEVRSEVAVVQREQQKMGETVDRKLEAVQEAGRKHWERVCQIASQVESLHAAAPLHQRIGTQIAEVSTEQQRVAQRLDGIEEARAREAAMLTDAKMIAKQLAAQQRKQQMEQEALATTLTAQKDEQNARLEVALSRLAALQQRVTSMDSESAATAASGFSIRAAEAAATRAVQEAMEQQRQRQDQQRNVAERRIETLEAQVQALVMELEGARRHATAVSNLSTSPSSAGGAGLPLLPSGSSSALLFGSQLAPTGAGGNAPSSMGLGSLLVAIMTRLENVEGREGARAQFSLASMSSTLKQQQQHLDEVALESRSTDDTLRQQLADMRRRFDSDVRDLKDQLVDVVAAQKSIKAASSHKAVHSQKPVHSRRRREAISDDSDRSGDSGSDVGSRRRRHGVRVKAANVRRHHRRYSSSEDDSASNTSSDHFVEREGHGDKRQDRRSKKRVSKKTIAEFSSRSSLDGGAEDREILEFKKSKSGAKQLRGGLSSSKVVGRSRLPVEEAGQHLQEVENDLVSLRLDQKVLKSRVGRVEADVNGLIDNVAGLTSQIGGLETKAEHLAIASQVGMGMNLPPGASQEGLESLRQSIQGLKSELEGVQSDVERLQLHVETIQPPVSVSSSAPVVSEPESHTKGVPCGLPSTLKSDTQHVPSLPLFSSISGIPSPPSKLPSPRDLYVADKAAPSGTRISTDFGLTSSSAFDVPLATPPSMQAAVALEAVEKLRGQMSDTASSTERLNSRVVGLTNVQQGMGEKLEKLSVQATATDSRVVGLQGQLAKEREASGGLAKEVQTLKASRRKSGTGTGNITGSGGSGDAGTQYQFGLRSLSPVQSSLTRRAWQNKP